MRDFSDWICHHDLFDLPLRGADFTWSDLQKNAVMRRLDRFLVSLDWLETCFAVSQKALPRPISDHCPLLLETRVEDWGSPPFRFELMWLSEMGFADGVKN